MESLKAGRGSIKRFVSLARKLSAGSPVAFCRFQVPLDELFYCPVPRIPRTMAGLPLAGSWNEDRSLPVTEHTKIQMCLKHWLEGKSWEETGIIDLHLYHVREYGPSAHGWTRSEFLRRYERLDELRSQSERLGEIPVAAQNKIRNPGGILFHVVPRVEGAENMSHHLNQDSVNCRETEAPGVSGAWKSSLLSPMFGGLVAIDSRLLCLWASSLCLGYWARFIPAPSLDSRNSWA